MMKYVTQCTCGWGWIGYMMAQFVAEGNGTGNGLGMRCFGLMVHNSNCGYINMRILVECMQSQNLYVICFQIP